MSKCVLVGGVLIAVFLQIGDGTSSSYIVEVGVSNPLQFSNGIS